MDRKIADMVARSADVSRAVPDINEVVPRRRQRWKSLLSNWQPRQIATGQLVGSAVNTAPVTYYGHRIDSTYYYMERM